MSRTKWENLFALWRQQYYLDFFVIICLLIALVTIIKFRRKEKIYYFFLSYILSAFFLFPICDIITLLLLDLNPKSVSYVTFIETVNIIFALIEYIVLFIFFYSILKFKIIKLLMIVFIPFAIMAVTAFIFKSQNQVLSVSEIRRFDDILISAELLFIGLLCIAYYFELLTKKPSINLIQSPSFWIVSGLFFYCFMTAPFFLVSEWLAFNLKQSYCAFYCIHYISFGTFFLAITKAFLCKKPLTT
jgi:hypothetical protein